jgi:hypothetical protein
MNINDPIIIPNKDSKANTNRETIKNIRIREEKYIFYKRKDSVSSIDSSLSILNDLQKETVSEKVRSKNLFFLNNVISLRKIPITYDFPKLGIYYTKSLSSRTVMNNKDKCNLKNKLRKVII